MTIEQKEVEYVHRSEFSAVLGRFVPVNNAGEIGRGADGEITAAEGTRHSVVDNRAKGVSYVRDFYNQAVQFLGRGVTRTLTGKPAMKIAENLPNDKGNNFLTKALARVKGLSGK